MFGSNIINLASIAATIIFFIFIDIDQIVTFFTITGLRNINSIELIF